MGTRKLISVAAALVVCSLAAFTGAAAATVPPPNSDTLTVTLSCGCVLFNNGEGFPAGITGGLPVGAAPYTPAANNHGAATFTP